MKPVFKNDGSVTARNQSGINDRAAAVVLISGQKATKFKITLLAMIKANVSGSVIQVS